MTTLQPSHPDHYRSLPPPQMYGHAPPGHYQQPLPYPPQPAPRQRTAIACRYCRRRKVCFPRPNLAVLLLTHARFDALDLISPRMVVVPTASVSHRNVSLHPSQHNRRHSSRRILSGDSRVPNHSNFTEPMVSLFLLNSTATPTLHRNTPTLHKATLLKAHQSMLCPQATCSNRDLLMVMLRLRNPPEHQTLVKKLVANVPTRSHTRQLCLPQTLRRLLRLLNNNNNSNKDLLHLTASLSTPTLTPLS
jgi:hypothetical protein